MSELWGMDEGEYSPLIASGVYVKGMEMPRGCFFCICNKHLDPDTDMCLLTQDAFDSTFQVVEHRRDNCPLVEIPPHGRLIDADAPMRQVEHDTPLSTVFEKTIRRYLYNAPTIIPTSKQEVDT